MPRLIWEAFDGKQFATEAECRAYELEEDEKLRIEHLRGSLCSPELGREFVRHVGAGQWKADFIWKNRKDFIWLAGVLKEIEGLPREGLCDWFGDCELVDDDHRQDEECDDGYEECQESELQEERARRHRDSSEGSPV